MQQTDLATMRARTLRQTMTPAEYALWYALRDRRLLGLKFRRQVPIGPWIADFYCAGHRLIVEADGGGHGGLQDKARDRWLSEREFRILRFWNGDILANLSGCLQAIATETARCSATLPPPTIAASPGPMAAASPWNSSVPTARTG